MTEEALALKFLSILPESIAPWVHKWYTDTNKEMFFSTPPGAPLTREDIEAKATQRKLYMDVEDAKHKDGGILMKPLLAPTKILDNPLRSKPICHNCGQEGHYATNCPLPPQQSSTPNFVPSKKNPNGLVPSLKTHHKENKSPNT